MASDDRRSARGVLGLPIEVLLLGVVSFLTDVSSEMIFAILPLFLTGVLGASALVLGAMEGAADFAASSLDMVSGSISDRTGKRKRFAVLGYGISALSKIVLVVASTATQVVAFRVVERLGKSIRGAPRDALLSAVAPEQRRGVAFGVHKALDKSGAIVGPLFAYTFLEHDGRSLSSFHTLFVGALVPAFLSVVVLALFVRERPTAGKSRLPLREAVSTFGPGYRHYLVSAGIFSAGYFSFAFLLLAASRVGFAMKDVALLYALFNASFTLVSVPVGRLSDRLGRRPVIALSYILYALMAIGFVFAHTKLAVVSLFVLYGIFYAIDEGQTKAYVTDLVPEGTRATALGAYGFVTAVIYLPASLLAGLLWTTFGPTVTFGVAAVIAILALGHLLAVSPHRASDLRRVA